MTGDENYINKFPEDAVEIARIVRHADDVTAVALLKLWGSKQRDIGAIKSLERIRSAANLEPFEVPNV